MADTKLKDENSLSGAQITTGSQIYIEKETVPGNGIWQPFRTLISSIVTFLAGLFLKTDGTTTGATAGPQEFTNGTSTIIDEDNFYIQTPTALIIKNTAENGTIVLNTEASTFIKVANGDESVYSRLRSDGSIEGLSIGHPNAMNTPADAIIINGVKVYKAMIGQSATNAPNATVLENTLGEVPVWARSSTGVYTLTAVAGVFIGGKTLVRQHGLAVANFDTSTTSYIKAVHASDTAVELHTYDDNFTLQDDILDGIGGGGGYGFAFEILIYP